MFSNHKVGPLVSIGRALVLDIAKNSLPLCTRILFNGTKGKVICWIYKEIFKQVRVVGVDWRRRDRSSDKLRRCVSVRIDFCGRNVPQELEQSKPSIIVFEVYFSF